MFNLLALYAGANTPKRFGTMNNNADVAKIGGDISSPRTRPGPSGILTIPVSEANAAATPIDR